MDTLFFGLFAGACAASLWLLLAKSFPRRPALEQLGHAIALGLMFVFALTVSPRVISPLPSMGILTMLQYLVLDVDASLHGFVANAGDAVAMMHGVTDIPDSRSHWATKMTILYVQIVLADAFMVTYSSDSTAA